MRKAYEKPSIESETAFETLAAGCTVFDPALQAECEEPPLQFTPGV